MRPLALASRLRRQSRLLALAPLMVAGATVGCIAGEPIAPVTEGTIPGRYVLTMLSEGVSSDSLPIFAYRTTEGLPAYLRYATLDMYDDSTYVEVYQIDVLDASEEEVVDTRWDVGNGTWSLSGTEISFKSTLRPSLYPTASAWSGFLGSAGPYAFNIERLTSPSRFMHYRRY